MKRCEIYVSSILIFLLFCLAANAGENHSAAALQTAEGPNHFEMRSGNINISFTYLTDVNCPSLFIYRDTGQPLTFQGEEIRQSDSEIGRQITVTIEQIPDLRTITFTLLLPHINLERPEAFRTVGITTITRTSIGGPEMVKGPIQTYVSRVFRGTAGWFVPFRPCRSSSD